jgi:LEA14-like dessication related protein
MKQTKHKILIVVIILLTLVLSLVVLFERPQISGIKEVSFEKKENEEIFASCKLELTNKSWFDISCNTLKTEVYYNNNIIAEGILKDPVFLKSNVKADLPILVKIHKSQLYEGVKDLLFKDSINIVMKTEGKCTWANISFKNKNEKWIKTSEIISLLKENIGSTLEDIFGTIFSGNNFSPSIIETIKK